MPFYWELIDFAEFCLSDLNDFCKLDFFVSVLYIVGTTIAKCRSLQKAIVEKVENKGGKYGTFGAFGIDK
jgi:hypothetical protein